MAGVTIPWELLIAKGILLLAGPQSRVRSKLIVGLMEVSEVQRGSSSAHG